MKILDFATTVLGLTLSPLQAVFAKTAAGEPLDANEAQLFARHAGRAYVEVQEPPSEIVLVCGRQSGKSNFIVPVITLHMAMAPETTAGLAAGIWRDICVISPTKKQSRVIYQRLAALIQTRPQLKRHVQRITADEFTFDFGCRVAVWPATAAHIRGLQVPLAILDEAAFLRQAGPTADVDLIDAIRASQVVLPHGQIISVTSPWMRSGHVYQVYRRRAELGADTVCFQASTAALNPHASQKFLDRERRRDPELFRREFLAEFIDSISSFLPGEAIEACVVHGRSKVPPEPGVRYVAAVDAAFARDTFVLGIAHAEGGRIIIDRLRGWEPHNRRLRLDQLLPELVEELKPYGIRTMQGDQFSHEALREVFSHHNLVYQERTFTVQSKMDFYGALKRAIVEESIELLDDASSLRELRCLEARQQPGGATRIEAPSGSGHSDDYSDVLALLAFELRPSVTPGYVACGGQPQPGDVNLLTVQF